MDTFIVRFYRRTLRWPQEVAGTVERVGSGERAGFADARELLERLLPGGGADAISPPAQPAAPQDDDLDLRRAADQRRDDC